MTNRKEVAKKLREGGIARNVSEAYVLLLHCIGIRPQLPAVNTYKPALERLADLIDTTCHMSWEYGNGDDDTEEYMEEIAGTHEDTVACHCHECDEVFRYDRGIIPNYCPACGARVVRDEA